MVRLGLELDIRARSTKISCRDNEQRRHQAAHDEPHQHEWDRAEQCVAPRAAQHHIHVV